MTRSSLSSLESGSSVHSQKHMMASPEGPIHGVTVPIHRLGRRPRCCPSLAKTRAEQREKERFWKLYVPGCLVIIIICSLIGGYAFYTLSKQKKEAVMLQNKKSTAETIFYRTIDSADGTLRKGEPLNAFDLSIYQGCQRSIETLDPISLYENMCLGSCGADLGIVSNKVLNFCVLGDIYQAMDSKNQLKWMMSTRPCEWEGIKCNVNGEMEELSISLSSPIKSFSDRVMYFKNLKKISISAPTVVVNSKPYILPPLFEMESLQSISLSRLGWKIVPPLMFTSTLTSIELDSLPNLVWTWNPSIQNLSVEKLVISKVNMTLIPAWLRAPLWNSTLGNFTLSDCKIGNNTISINKLS
jgi:hypothetical protein